MGENGKFSHLSWQSKRVKRIVRSTLAGETLAMSDGIDNSIFLSTLFSELTTGDAEHASPIICVTDNHSLADALKSTKSELVQTQRVERVLWYNTKEQVFFST